MTPPRQRLRLLLAISSYQPERGGAAEWLRDYANWLLARGHEVGIACERAETAVPFAGTLLTLPADQHTKNSWKRAWALQKLAAQYPADLVHDTGCLPSAGVFHPLMGSLTHNWYRQLRAFPPALRWRRFGHVRVWRDVRLQWHQRRHHKLLLACSQRVAADFKQLGCHDSVIVPNGIRLPEILSPNAVADLRRELQLGDRLLVLVTATNFYLKGVMTVLRAVNLLDQDARKRLLVVITGHNREAVFPEYIRRHALADCCRLTGWVKDIEAYYSAADVFLHPTHHDAGSLSTLKALAAGCAVVTSRFDGSADLIRHTINGLVLNNPADALELADVIRQLFDADLRRRLGAAARQLAPSLDQQHQFARLEALYSRVLKEERFAT